MFYKTDSFLGTETTNPVINTVLVTTGALDELGPTGCYINIQPILTSSVNAKFKIQIWNGSAEAKSVNINVLANDTQMTPVQAAIKLPNGFHLRVLNPAAITGVVQASLIIGYIAAY